MTRVTEALTEPVSVAGARQDVTETVNVGFQDPALRLKTPRQATVTVPMFRGRWNVHCKIGRCACAISI